MNEPLLETSLMVHPPLVGRMGCKPVFEDDMIASRCYSDGTLCRYLTSGLSQIERHPMNEHTHGYKRGSTSKEPKWLRYKTFVNEMIQENSRIVITGGGQG